MVVAVAVVTIGGAAILLAARGHHENRAAAHSTSLPTKNASIPTRSTSRPAAPVETKRITYRHLAITIPSSWIVDNQRCGTPLGNTILLPGPVFLCYIPRPPGISWAKFVPADAPDEFKAAHRRALSVGGHRAYELTGTYEKLQAIFVRVPDASAGILIISPHGDLAAQLAQTLRFVDVDAHGCPAESRYEPLSALPPPEMPGARTTLVPGTPTEIVVCGYQQNLLFQGGEISAGGLGAAVTTLNGLPHGLSRDAHPEPACGSNPPDQLDEPDFAEWFAVLVHYADAPDLLLHARVGMCGNLGITNGAATGQSTPALLDHVLSAVGMSTDGPGRVVPAR